VAGVSVEGAGAPVAYGGDAVSKHTKTAAYPEDMLPDICPLKDDHVGNTYALFGAMEGLRAGSQAQTYLFLYYTQCPLCHTDAGEPIYHWSVFSIEQMKWARAIDPFFMHGYDVENRPGIFRVDLNTMCRLRRHRGWLGEIGEWIAKNPWPPYYNEWQKAND
jgi:hypothetical protein